MSQIIHFPWLRVETGFVGGRLARTGPMLQCVMFMKKNYHRKMASAFSLPETIHGMSKCPSEIREGILHVSLLSLLVWLPIFSQCFLFMVLPCHATDLRFWKAFSLFICLVSSDFLFLRLEIYEQLWCRQVKFYCSEQRANFSKRQCITQALASPSIQIHCRSSRAKPSRFPPRPIHSGGITTATRLSFNLLTAEPFPFFLGDPSKCERKSHLCRNTHRCDFSP